MKELYKNAFQYKTLVFPLIHSKRVARIIITPSLYPFNPLWWERNWKSMDVDGRSIASVDRKKKEEKKKKKKMEEQAREEEQIDGRGEYGGRK